MAHDISREEEQRGTVTLLGSAAVIAAILMIAVIAFAVFVLQA